MRTFAALLALGLSFAQAANTGPQNLQGVKICFSPLTVQSNPDIDTKSSMTKADVARMVETKLAAYRVPRFDSCVGLAPDLYVQIDGVVSASGLVVYSISLDVFRYDLLPAPVSVWSVGRFGAITASGQPLSDVFTDAVSKMVDSFAADYAKANP